MSKMLSMAYQREQQDVLKCMITQLYDKQHTRIAAGNRLYSHFIETLGAIPGHHHNNLTPKSQELLQILNLSFNKITEGIASEVLKKKGIFGRVTLPQQVSSDLITEYKDWVIPVNQLFQTPEDIQLVYHWLREYSHERELIAHLEPIAQQFPIYDWLLSKRGIGPQMAAVLVAHVDIHRCKYYGQLQRYCGLDVVTKNELVSTNAPEGQSIFPEVVDFIDRDNMKNHPFKGELTYVNRFTKQEVDENGHDTQRWYITVSLKVGKSLFNATYRVVTYGARSKRSEHLETRKYLDKNGKEKEKLSITYNWWLRVKILGVMSSSILRAKHSSDNEYAPIYDNYRHRYDCDPRKQDWSDGRKHRAAIRAMINILMCDFHRTWRLMCGYAYMPPYGTAKLGLRDHWLESPDGQAYLKLQEKKAVSNKSRGDFTFLADG